MHSVLLAMAVVAVVMLFGAAAAHAGADNTFDTALTKFTDFLEGSGGKIITVMSLAGGMVALRVRPLQPGSGRRSGCRWRRCGHRRSDRHLDRHRDDLRLHSTGKAI